MLATIPMLVHSELYQFDQRARSIEANVTTSVWSTFRCTEAVQRRGPNDHYMKVYRVVFTIAYSTGSGIFEQRTDIMIRMGRRHGQDWRRSSSSLHKRLTCSQLKTMIITAQNVKCSQLNVIIITAQEEQSTRVTYSWTDQARTHTGFHCDLSWRM